VERIAINAVMAGCPPETMPVLMAAVEALADAEFNLQAIQATTNPVAIWVIVSGPAAQALGFEDSFNCLGEGNRANATVGRAVRLLLRNVGGALPGEMDRSTQGQPGRYTMCCAENQARSPWTPLRDDYGLGAQDSAVTVVGIEGTMNMNTHSKEVNELLRVFAQTMVHPPSNEYVHGGEPWLMICPEHDIRLMVAGGPGTHSVYIPCFGNSRAATRKIVLPS